MFNHRSDQYQDTKATPLSIRETLIPFSAGLSTQRLLQLNYSAELTIIKIYSLDITIIQNLNFRYIHWIYLKFN